MLNLLIWQDVGHKCSAVKIADQFQAQRDDGQRVGYAHQWPQDELLPSFPLLAVVMVEERGGVQGDDRGGHDGEPFV